MIRSYFIKRIFFSLCFAGAGTITLSAAEPRQRTFQFTYAGTVTGVPEGKTVRVWLPLPPSGPDQTVRIGARELPAEGRIQREPLYGNEVLYFETKATPAGVPFAMKYLVTRREVKADSTAAKDEPLARFLQADVNVPIDGKPLELLRGQELPKSPLAAGRSIYDIVNRHMRYSKEGKGWGRGDSAWACQSGYGNCTDFHSLFISLVRSRKIPAKFEIGFGLPEKPGSGPVAGYHCWAKFKSGKDWVPVDISEANKNPKLRDYYFGNLSPDRVTFSVGRDIVLVPKQAGPPLNYFVYPYVEVDGKPYTKVEKRFSYEDRQKPE